MQRPVVIGLSPNTDRKDYLEALTRLVNVGQWREGSYSAAVSEWFKKRFNVAYAIPFNAGRSALLAILASAGIGKGDEVLVQAFTCVAVANSILWAGAKPIFVDIDNSLNIDPIDVEK